MRWTRRTRHRSFGSELAEGSRWKLIVQVYRLAEFRSRRKQTRVRVSFTRDGVRVFATRSTTQDAIDRFSSRRRRRLVAPSFLLLPLPPLFPFVDSLSLSPSISLRATLPREARYSACETRFVKRRSNTRAPYPRNRIFVVAALLATPYNRRARVIIRAGVSCSPRYTGRVRDTNNTFVCVYEGRRKGNYFFRSRINPAICVMSCTFQSNF